MTKRPQEQRAMWLFSVTSLVKTIRAVQNCVLNIAFWFKRHRKILLEMVTIGLIAYYAAQARRQANEAHVAAVAATTTANAAESLNSIGHENAVKELRAYISVGAPGQKMAEIHVVPRTGVVSIPVLFFNGGRTPAHHFLATIETQRGGYHDVRPAEITEIDNIKRDAPHIERFIYLTHVTRPNYGGLDVAANSTVTVFARSDITAQDLKPDNGPVVNWGPIVRVLGTFEYCDEFGGYHCNEIDLTYDKSAQTFASGWYMDIDCGLGPVVPHGWRSEAVRVLTRCEQPSEQNQAQKEADQNAGKIFFPASTPIPQSTSAAKP